MDSAVFIRVGVGVSVVDNVSDGVKVNVVVGENVCVSV